MTKKDYINRKMWDDPSKLEARSKSIIEMYRSLSKRDCIPDDQQYWTMCGNLCNEEGGSNPNNELLQMVGSGLIRPEQFVGVEIYGPTHEKNVHAFPDIDLRHNDIVQELNLTAKAGLLNPAIVNVDTPNLPAKASRILSKILKLLACVPKEDILVVCNVVMNNPYKNGSVSSVDENSFVYLMRNNVRWQDCKDRWLWHGDLFSYRNHKNTVQMSTFVFSKKSRFSAT